jgi:DNA-binding NtrC family response regulator
VEQRLRILLVEDDRENQMACERFVKREGLPYEYEIARSVSEAKRALTTGEFDAVLADYTLGDGVAFDLFGEVEAIPLVVLVESGDEQIAVEAMKQFTPPQKP